MNEKELLQTYKMISEFYEKYLKACEVKAIKLKDKNGNFTKDALVLIYLAQNYPNTKAISKAELSEFIRKFYPQISDVQQARHLSKQKGYYIVSGTRGDRDEKIPAGFYKLISLEKAYPAYKPDRREGIKSEDFEELKRAYDYRCATCGSRENEAHHIRKNEKVKLQMRHMNPAKPLEFGNIIPQCQVCNRPDRDRWIYDKTGRVIEIADSDDGKRVVEKYLKRVSVNTKLYFLEFLKKLLKIK